MTLRQDALYPLRLYGAGYVDGYAFAAVSDRLAIEFEAKAGAVLHALHVPLDAARAIIEQARHDAALEHPDLDAVEQRALAAAHIIHVISRRIDAVQLVEAA